MKLTLWQQFDSNNSSSYVIVGAFETPRKAQDAADEFKKLLRRIWEWYAAHPDVREAVLEEEGHPVTDAERDIMRDYNIEFDRAIEWVAREESPDFLPEAVTAFENLVFVATVDETVTEDKPLAQFMHHLGAEVKYEEAMKAYSTLTLTATAPDEMTTQFIKSASENFLLRDHNLVWQRPPWVLFCDGQFVADPEQLSSDVDTFIANYYAWRQWHVHHRAEIDPLVKQREAAWRAKDEQAASILDEQIRELLSGQHHVEPRMPPDVYKRTLKIMAWTSPDFDEQNGVILADRHSITIRGISVNDEIGHGLPAIVAWLRALGCIDVKYEFESFPFK